MKNKLLKFLLLLYISAMAFSALKAQKKGGNEVLMVKLENPVSVEYLKAKLSKKTPRLILTPSIEANLKKKIKSDPVVGNYYKAVNLT